MKISLSYLPDKTKQLILIIKDKLLEKEQSLGIQKVILFGSFAKGAHVEDWENGYISDIDILLIVKRKKNIDWISLREEIKKEGHDFPQVLSVLTETLKEINQRLKRGHYFFKDIAEQGILLWERDDEPLAIIEKEFSKEEWKGIQKEHFEQWFPKAESNIHHAMLAKKVGTKTELNKAAFELHQATESLLSCALLMLTNYKPKTHSIEELLRLCKAWEEQFCTAFPHEDKATPFEKEAMDKLQKAYIEARYSKEYEISQEELLWLTERIENLKDLVSSIFKR